MNMIRCEVYDQMRGVCEVNEEGPKKRRQKLVEQW